MIRTLILVFLSFQFKFAIYSQISNEQVYKFNRVMDLISMFYVDTIQENKLVEKAIISVLKDLDPHSIYISKEDVDEMNEPLVGSFDGIGITYNLLHDTVYVLSTLPGGPSQRLGIRAGDRIVSIENDNIAGIGINSETVKSRLEGKKGSIVKIAIKRKGTSGILPFAITREPIPIFSIDAAYQVDEKTGYIKLNKFSGTTIDEFNQVAKKLKKGGVENLILDLRDNGGGYLKTAIDLTDQFLNDKRMIAYTHGISSPKTEYFSTSKGLFKECRLIVLIDEGTASASEIFSGAIQDWDEGLLVGRRSYGKGLVQRPFHLMDGSLIRLTIARYYTPTGRLIQKPYSEGYDKYSSDIYKRTLHGELYSSDSIHFPDSLKYFTLSSKRPVYGGGGIMPDIFIPIDTSSYPMFYQKIRKNGKLYDFILTYVDQKRTMLNKEYADFEIFKKHFELEDDFLQSLVKFSILENIQDKLSSEELLAIEINKSFELPNNLKIFNLDNPRVKNDIKALIARNLYSNKEYYEILNMTDDAFQRAVEVINNEKQYYSLLQAN